MRCKACDVPLQPAEIIWIEELKEHDPLCTHCKVMAVEGDDLVVPVLSNEVEDVNLLDDIDVEETL